MIVKLKKINWVDFTSIFEEHSGSRKEKIYNNFIEFLKAELNIKSHEKPLTDKTLLEDEKIEKNKEKNDILNLDESIFEKNESFNVDEDLRKKLKNMMWKLFLIIKNQVKKLKLRILLYILIEDYNILQTYFQQELIWII